MIRTAAVSLALVALVALGMSSCVDDGGPRLDAATPAAAPRRARVVLTGQRLCGPGGDCASAAGAIRIGESGSVVQAMVIAYADDRAEIQIPEIAPLGPTKLIVTVNELASNALPFEVLAGDVP